MDKIDLCRELCKKLHDGQKRFDGSDYYLHPYRVAAKFENTGNENDLIYAGAGYLHDVIEDCGVTAQWLMDEGVPYSVVRIVEIVTKREGEDYFDFIRRINKDPMAREVKIEDIKDNLSDKPSRKQIAKYNWALGYFTAAQELVY